MKRFQGSKWIAAFLAALILMSGLNIVAVAELFLPRMLLQINEEAFRNNTGVQGLVVLPSRVEQIGARAWQGSGVYALDIPASVSAIGDDIVRDSRVNYVLVRSQSAALTERAFASANLIFAPDGSTAASYAQSHSIDFVPLDSLALCDGFYYRLSDTATLVCAKDSTTLAKRIEIPGTVKGKPVRSIGRYAFVGCEALTRLALPDGVEIASGALSMLTNTEIVGLPTFRIASVRCSAPDYVYVDSAVTWVANAANAEGSAEYRFTLDNGDRTVAEEPFGQNNYFTQQINESGTYTLTVEARDESGQVEQVSAKPLTAYDRHFSCAGVDASAAPYMVGEEATWTVRTENALSPVTYAFTLLNDAGEVVAQSVGNDATFRYTPAAGGDRTLQVLVTDASGYSILRDIGQIHVYARDEAAPTAPTLVFPESQFALAASEADAPTYPVQSVRLAWTRNPFAQSYGITLDRNSPDGWTNLLTQDVDQPGYQLERSLFTDAEGASLYRLGLSAVGLRPGEASYTYFWIDNTPVDDSLLVNGSAAIVWRQASRRASAPRTFTVSSQLAWTAKCDADWVSVELPGDGTIVARMTELSGNASREATIIVANGANSCRIELYQDTADAAPTIVYPVGLSTDPNAPTSIPEGGLSIKGTDATDGVFGRYRLRVFSGATAADGALLYTASFATGSSATLSAEDMGFAFSAGNRYVLELTGFVSSTYAQYEVEQDALRTRYYIRAVSGGHTLAINGEPSVAFIDSGSTIKCYVEGSNLWTCSSDAAWLTVSTEASSSAAQSVSLYAEDNLTAEARIGHVTFVCGTATAVATVAQKAQKAEIRYPGSLSQDPLRPTTLYLDAGNVLSSESIELAYYGQSLNIAAYQSGTVGADTVLSSSSSPSLHFFKFKAALDSFSIRTDKTYRLSVALGEQTTSYYVVFSDEQEQAYPVLLDSDIYDHRTIPAEGKAWQYTLTAMGAWRATSDVSWLTLSAASGRAGDTTLAVTVTQNQTGSPRFGRFSVTSTATGDTVWVYVEQLAQTGFLVASDTRLIGATYDCGLYRGAKCSVDDNFRLYGGDDIRVTSGSDWITLNSARTKTTDSYASGASLKLYLTENPYTGQTRTGSVTIQCGASVKTLTVRQLPNVQPPALLSPQISNDSDNPSFLPYQDVTLRWSPSVNAVRYGVTLIGNGTHRIDSILADGQSCTASIPKEWMSIDSTSRQYFKVYAYDAHGYSTLSSYYFNVSSGDRVHIDGESAPAWVDVPDVQSTRTLMIQSTGAWTAVADSGWMTLSAAGGASGDTLTLTLAENATSVARSGSVTLRCGAATAVLAVTQCGVLPQYPTILRPLYSDDRANPTMLPADTSSIEVGWSEERQAEYEVSLMEYSDKSAGHVVAESRALANGVSSYTFTGLTLKKGQLYWIELTRYCDRWRATSDISCYFMLSDENAWVSADDLARGETLLLEAEGDEDALYCTVKGSGTWTASTDADWLVLYKRPMYQDELDEDGRTQLYYAAYTGAPDTRLCVTALENATGSLRTGTITVRCGSASMTIQVKQYQRYVLAQLVSPALSDTSATVSTLPFGSVALRWSAAQYGTGSYEIVVYASDQQRTGYSRVFERTGLTRTQYTIPASVFTEGLYYRIGLYTGLGGDEWAGHSYYLRMGPQNALTATAQVTKTASEVGAHVGVQVSASGGVGAYSYAYMLMQGDTVLMETAYERMSYYSFAAPQAGGYYVRVYVKDEAGNVVIVNSDRFDVTEAVDSIALPSSGCAAPADGDVIAMQVSASGAWQATSNVAWISVVQNANGAVLTVDGNGTSAARTGVVSFRCSSAEATFTVRQAAKTTAGIRLSKDCWNAEYVEDALNLAVTADAAWSITQKPAWVTVSQSSGMGSASLTLTIEQNAGLSRDGQVVFACGAATATLSVTQKSVSESVRVTDITADRTSALVGQEITFTVRTTGAEQVLLLVDGRSYDEPYPVNNGVAVVKRAFSSIGENASDTATVGERSISFIPLRNGLQGSVSRACSITVQRLGRLAGTRIGEDMYTTRAGGDVQLSWSAVPHADSYAVYVSRDGSAVFTQTGITACGLTIPGSTLNALGDYVLLVMASGQGYSQSQQAAIIRVTTAAEPVIETGRLELSGRILYTDGTGVADAVVMLQNADGGYITEGYSDADGGWTITTELAAGDYTIVYQKPGMSFTPATEQTHYDGFTDIPALNARASDLVDADQTAKCTFTTSATKIMVGEAVTFTVKAPDDATAVRMWVDSRTYAGDEYPVRDGEATVERTFTAAHPDGMQICFQPIYTAAYGVKSAPTRIVVNAKGTLASPALAAPAEHAPGEAYAYRWTDVRNADMYRVTLYRDSVNLYREYYATSEAAQPIDGAYLRKPGEYSLEIIATGDGYSQSEAYQTITVASPDYHLQINKLKSTDTYVVGDTMWINASHLGGYMRICVTEPGADGKVAVFPSYGSQMTEANEYAPSVKLTKGGTYTIDAYVFTTNAPLGNDEAYDHVGPITIEVGGPTVYGVYPGGKTFTWINPDELPLTTIVTNNAVDTLAITENGTVLAALDSDDYQQDPATYRRTYTLSTLPAQSKGRHAYTFTAQNEQGMSASVDKSFYIVEPIENGDVVYPRFDSLSLVSSPIGGTTVTTATGGATFATLIVIGDAGDWYQLQTNDGTKGFARKTDVTAEAPEKACGRVVLSQPGANEKIELNTPLAISWRYGVAVKRTHQLELKLTKASGEQVWIKTLAAVDEQTVLDHYTYNDALPKGDYKLKLTVRDRATGNELYQSDTASITVATFSADQKYRQWWKQQVLPVYNQSVRSSTIDPIGGMRGENFLFVIKTYDEACYGFTQALEGYEQIWRLGAMKFVEDYNDSARDQQSNSQNNYALLTPEQLDRRALVTVAKTVLEASKKDRLVLKNDYSNMSPSSVTNWKVNCDSVIRNIVLDSVDVAYGTIKTTLDGFSVANPATMEKVDKIKKPILQIVDLLQKVATDSISAYYASKDATTILQAYANEYWSAICDASDANINYLKQTYWGDKWNASGYDGESRYQIAARKCIRAFTLLKSDMNREAVRNFAITDMLKGTGITAAQLQNESARNKAAVDEAMSPETLWPSIKKGCKDLLKMAIKESTELQKYPMFAQILEEIIAAVDKLVVYDNAKGYSMDVGAFWESLRDSLGEEVASDVVKAIVTYTYDFRSHSDYNPNITFPSGNQVALSDQFIKNKESILSSAESLVKDSWKLGESLCNLGHDVIESTQQSKGKGAYDDEGVSLLLALKQINDIRVEGSLIVMTPELTDTMSIANLETLRSTLLHLINAKELALICYQNMNTIRLNSKESWNSQYVDLNKKKHDYVWLSEATIRLKKQQLNRERDLVGVVPVSCLKAIGE